VSIQFDNWPFAQTVTIAKQGVVGADEYGDDVYWTVSSKDVQVILMPLLLKRPPRATRPGGFGEDLSGEFSVATGYTMFAPVDSGLVITDNVLINGVEWSPDGDPGLIMSPWSGISMIQIELYRITG
jgi:hypothetical protein